MATETNQSIPPHRRPFDPDFKAYTIYRHGGRREIVWGYSREAAMATIDPITDFDIVIEDLDCNYFWSEQDNTWLRRLKLEVNFNHSIEEIRAALENSELGHVRYTFRDGWIVDISRDYGHYDGGAIRYITVGLAEPTEPPADYDVDHPEYGKNWYMGYGSLMFRPFDWSNAAAAFTRIITAESRYSFKRELIEGALKIEDLQADQADELP